MARRSLPNGWQHVADNYYARGAYRVQGRGNRWQWWHVVRLALNSPSGEARSRDAAMAAADASLASLIGRVASGRSPGDQP